MRVLDLTRFFAGPLCTLMLADLGAEVIKVETSERELAGYSLPYQFGSGATFLQLKRGKRAITLNLRKEKGIEILKRLLINIAYPSETLKQFMTPFVLNPENIQRAPLLGEHTVEVLRESGYSHDEINNFKQEGVL